MIIRQSGICSLLVIAKWNNHINPLALNTQFIHQCTHIHHLETNDTRTKKTSFWPKIVTTDEKFWKASKKGEFKFESVQELYKCITLGCQNLAGRSVEK